MEAVAAPIAQSTKPRTAPPLPAKPVPKPGPTESRIKPATVQKASGNLAIQRAVDSEVAEPAVTIQKAPASPQEDPGYQAVVKQLAVTAKHERTPPKKPDEKTQEVKEAAELPPEKVEEKSGYDRHLQTMESVPPPKVEDFTVAGFTEKFRAKIDEIASKLPQQKKDQGSVARVVAFAAEKVEAVQDVKTQNQNLSTPLRKEAEKNPLELKDKVPETPELKVDPPGNTPEIKNARAAVPKPKTNEEISMDAESRALDDSLKNHNVGGQTINIEESSLAYPVSGEKDFDEAGEAKRRAQEQIRKLIPSYRAQEKGVIAKSEAEIPNIVKSGLKKQHQTRSDKFDNVLGVQKDRESDIEGAKAAVFAMFQGFYKEAKRKVDEELAKVSNIETDFEAVLNKADQDFKAWVNQDLEYIYTPGFFDYSDWKDIHEKEIKEEYQRLRKEKGSENKFVGGFDYLYLEAMNIVRDRHAKKLFERAKNSFIWDVMRGVEKIGARVVEVLNNANKHIRHAKEETKKIYDGLDTKQQKEMATAFEAVMGQYESLEETVKDREREIIEDMARNYSRSVGKLQATFDAIKKDVLTSWLEKAWNKLKAIVNAIIEFATRIVELLGRMVGLVGDIISSPRAFFRNLITGISQGFSTFVERIDEFLATAFFDWIRGTSGVTVQLPKEWNAPGIFSLFTQLLNLSTETIWQRMEVVYDKTVANAFRRGEVLLDKGLEIFDIVKREGLGGLWDHIVESLGTLLSDTLDEMKETVLYAAIKKVFIEIGKMLIPGGGFIAIAEKIIRLVVFIVEARNKILDLIESFIASMENAVKGDIAGIVSKITGALTKFITVALDFLVAFFGLSDLKGKVERFIERMRSPIIRGIDFVLKKFKPLVMKGKELVAKGTEKVVRAGQKVVAKVVNWLGIRKRFTSEGETHTLFFRGSETLAELWVATGEMPFTTLLKSKQIEINGITDPTTKSRKQVALTTASNIYNHDIVRLKSALAATTDEASKHQLQSDLNDKFNDIVPHLVVIGVGSGGRLPKTNVTVGSPRGRADWVEADPVTKYESKKPDRVTVEPLGWASHIKTIANFDDIYVRLHLLHFDLGGPGNDTGNVTPGRKSENINMYNQTEQRAVDLVHEKSKVLWYRANVTGYRSEQGYTEFAEGIRVRYGFKEKKEDGEWVKVGDVLYDSVFPVTKPEPKGANDPVPTINTLTFDYWDDELKRMPNRPTRDVYRDLIKAKNKTGGYGDWAAFIGSKEFQVANVEYGGNLEDWFKSAIALGKIRSI